MSARSEPFDAPLVLSLSKDERVAQSAHVGERARGSTGPVLSGLALRHAQGERVEGSPRAFLHVVLAVVCAVVIWRLKRHYSEARVDDVRWILDPTARAVSAVTGARFEWEPGQGYLSRERLFVIAKPCAGVNFMIAAFGMTAWTLARRVVSAVSLFAVLAVSLLAAYSTAVVVNGARISCAVWMAAHPHGAGWMTAARMHRAEGITFYFAGLLLLYAVLQRFERRSVATPLVWYYAITILIPLANGAAGVEALLIEHALTVVAIPLALLTLAWLFGPRTFFLVRVSSR